MAFNQSSGDVIFRPTHSKSSSSPSGLPYMTTSNLAYELERLSPMSEMPPNGLRKKESNSLLKRSLSSSSSRSRNKSTSPILSLNAKVPTPPAMFSSLSPLPAPSPVLSYQSSQPSPSPMLSSASSMSSFSMNSPNPFFATSPYSDTSSRPSPISPYPSPLTPNKPFGANGRSTSSPVAVSPIYGILPFGPKSNRGVVNLNKAPSSISLRQRAEEDGTSFFPGSNLAKAHHILNYTMDSQKEGNGEQKRPNALWKLAKKLRMNPNKKDKSTPSINTFHRSDTISPTQSCLNSPTEPAGNRSVHWSAPAPSTMMPDKIAAASPRTATFPPLAPLTIYKDVMLHQQVAGPSPLSPAPRKHRAKVSSSLAGDAIEDDGDDVEECDDEALDHVKLNKNSWRKGGNAHHRRLLDSDEDNDITNNALRLQGMPPSSRSLPTRAGSPDAIAWSQITAPGWTAIRSEGRM